ncbi:hypothetical protein N7520_010602 [Penicillium odoratum]|uniref:uncharacterized protein n=1 Tax=Penicillium odoratum TaxID=1167516 RepID=UPI002547B648|nr:uncharacterized protein N7520_010602 [Penicillium odoratum]KAJ5745420.1 hypothetical protein N7520_010602 [Penicillium odoratum]
METIAYWIEDCDKNHPCCHRERAPHTHDRFARILDVGNVFDAPDVNLCLSDGLDLDVKYATLSHCWGGITSEIPSLTTRTYEEFLQRITIFNLPQTFKDAIQLTRRLEIRYLWIDSLCIIQDSREDWLIQSAVMGDIYKGSYLNIAATKSINPYGGLFTTRNPFVVTPLRVPIYVTVPLGFPVPQEQGLPFLRLEGDSLLVASPRQLALELTETELELDTCLGNIDGSFRPGGTNFSQSARRVELIGHTLYAELETLRKEWKKSSVDLSEVVETSDRSNFRLKGVSKLSISCKCTLDLNRYLGNRNGAFDVQETNFAHSARNVSLAGTTLCAELRTIDGLWRQSSIQLTDFISWQPGRLWTPKDGYAAQVFFDVGTNSYQKWSEQIANAKLCKRGWVLQERLLAPRTIHFTKQQLFWECTISQTLEEAPAIKVDNQQPQARMKRLDLKTWDVYSPSLLEESKERELGLNYIWSSFKALRGRDETHLRKEDLAHEFSLLEQTKRLCYGGENWQPTHPLIIYWSVIITGYSFSELTYIQDRLIAIAGLAKVLSARTGIRYAAGLWMTQVPRQLLWDILHRAKNLVNDGKYVAPSWSWASSPGFMTNGGRLDPILETKGAMDLIKILSVDVEGVIENDKMPFGQVRSGRLRIRGRLHPIKLDLSAWPRGAIREKALVQFWSGSALEVPMRETFLVPVIFTRWNERLPDATPNSLLLESTEEKGVFRRIGTARLSSRCDLRNVIPELYTALSRDHEDEDDDANSEDEAHMEDAEHFRGPFNSPTVEPNPQQEWADSMLKQLRSNVNKLEGYAKKNNAKLGSSSDSKLSAYAQNLSLVGKSLLSLVPGEPSKKVNLDTRELERELRAHFPGENITVGVRSEFWSQINVKKLKPKTAVASHCYLDYVEDDCDVIRYGHFVYEIR